MHVHHICNMIKFHLLTSVWVKCQLNITYAILTEIRGYKFQNVKMIQTRSVNFWTIDLNN